MRPGNFQQLADSVKEKNHRNEGCYRTDNQGKRKPDGGGSGEELGALKKKDQNADHEEMLIQEAQKKTDKGKWKGLAQTDRKEILMNPEENIRVGTKSGFQMGKIGENS